MHAPVPCFECGEPAGYNHHVIPKAQGGKHTVPLCAGCHEKVHGRSFTMHHGALTKRGQDAARALGHIPGRPRQVTQTTIRMLMAAMTNRTQSVTAIARQVGLHRATVYEYVDGHGRPTALGLHILGGRVHVEKAAAD